MVSYSNWNLLVYVAVCCSFAEFLSDRRQRVAVGGAASEWIPIVSGTPQWSVFCPLLFILYTSEMFALVENRLFAYADDSKLLAVVRKKADSIVVAASLNRDLARIQEWWNHSCMILNPSKTRSLVVDQGLWTLNMVSWPCRGFLSELVLTSTSLAWSLTASSPSKTMCMMLFPVSLRELVFWGWWNVYMWTPLCYWVAILHLFS